MKLLSALILLTVSMEAREKPDDFQSIVRKVESHYGKRHLRIPFLGAVTFASHLTRPLGASDLKLAVIEGVGPDSGDLPAFEPGPEWRPFIRTTSRDGEQNVMYAREEGNAVRVLMVTVSDDAVVMQMRLAPTAFLKFLADKSH